MELGDSEFERIRDQLTAYEREITRGLRKGDPLLIDKNSLAAFIKKAAIIQRIDREVSKATGLHIVFSEDFVEAYVPRLGYVGIKTVQEVEGLLEKQESLLTRFLIAWFVGPGASRSSLIPGGFALSFLCWSIALEKGGLAALTEFLEKHAFSKTRRPEHLASELLESYRMALRPRQHKFRSGK